VFKFCFEPERVRSLKREMTLFRLLKEKIGMHPNIVRLLDVHFDDPPYYVEMDYVEGQSLKIWCEQQGGVEKVPLATRLEIVAQAAEALHAAHSAGVVHRDVKPGNILIEHIAGAAPVAKLCDFGIGQVLSDEALAGVTKSGFTQSIIAEASAANSGTQIYMAPEMLVGQAATPQSDIYSLGVVLYQLATGDLHRPLTTDWPRAVEDAVFCREARGAIRQRGRAGEEPAGDRRAAGGFCARTGGQGGAGAFTPAVAWGAHRGGGRGGSRAWGGADLLRPAQCQRAPGARRDDPGDSPVRDHE
jgi:serine/threonine protein kinase